MPLLRVLPPQNFIFCGADWFYDCLKSSTQIKVFATFLSIANGSAMFF